MGVDGLWSVGVGMYLHEDSGWIVWEGMDIRPGVTEMIHFFSFSSFFPFFFFFFS